jgi:hypothetical protein
MNSRKSTGTIAKSTKTIANNSENVYFSDFSAMKLNEKP